MQSDLSDVAIVGAGPYGLSVAAHLRASGVSYRIFGSPMRTWRTQMPVGMHLKSEGFASNLSSPHDAFSLKDYCASRSIPYRDEGLPVRLDTFSCYGIAFQKRFVPDLDEREVISITQTHNGFCLGLDDGRTIAAKRVLVAVGIAAFNHLPTQLSWMPTKYLSHSAVHRDPSAFRGRDVAVIGGGASALDLAGLLHAEGAAVKLLCREPVIDIHDGPSDRPRTLWQRIRHPRTGIGHSMRSWLLTEAPMLFHALPKRLRLRIVRTHLGPAGGWFTKNMVIDKVPLMRSSRVSQARIQDGRVHLTIAHADGRETYLATDHVIAATGYRVDLRRLSFLDERMIRQVQCAGGAPVLSSNFESSLPGLYFVGAMAANSFGPMLRFVFGCRFASIRLSRHFYAARAAPAISSAPTLGQRNGLTGKG